MENTINRREKISKVFTQNRWVILVEILLAAGIVALHASGVVSTAVIYLFILGSISLWLRKSSWWQLGLKRPADWGSTIGYATIAGLGLQVISLYLIVPVTQRLTNQPLDLSQFESLKGDPVMLVTWLLVAWVIAAFGEEMVYRGYLLNRLGDLWGNVRGKWVVAIVASSVLFAFGHFYQGIPGMIDTFLFAAFMGGLYLWGQRNLWLVIIAHGVYDTLGFMLIYLGMYP